MVIWFFILCVLCDLCGSIQILVCQAYSLISFCHIVLPLWLPHQATEENFTPGTLKAFSSLTGPKPVAYLLLKES